MYESKENLVTKNTSVIHKSSDMQINFSVTN